MLASYHFILVYNPMFINEEELKAKLDNNSNLINILNPLLGKSMTDKIKVNALPELLDNTIDGIIENGIIINHDGNTRHTGTAGKVNGDSNVPQVLRNVIAIQAQFDSAQNLKHKYGLSQVQIDNYKKGTPNAALGLENKANADTTKAVETAIGRVTDKVIGRIEAALDNITDCKLENREAKELSSIIANLSRVMPSMANKDKNNAGANVQVVFMNPAPADAPIFKTIDI